MLKRQLLALVLIGVVLQVPCTLALLEILQNEATILQPFWSKLQTFLKDNKHDLQLDKIAMEDPLLKSISKDVKAKKLAQSKAEMCYEEDAAIGVKTLIFPLVNGWASVNNMTELGTMKDDVKDKLVQMFTGNIVGVEITFKNHGYITSTAHNLLILVSTEFPKFDAEIPEKLLKSFDHKLENQDPELKVIAKKLATKYGNANKKQDVMEIHGDHFSALVLPNSILDLEVDAAALNSKEIRKIQRLKNEGRIGRFAIACSQGRKWVDGSELSTPNNVTFTQFRYCVIVYTVQKPAPIVTAATSVPVSEPEVAENQNSAVQNSTPATESSDKKSDNSKGVDITINNSQKYIDALDGVLNSEGQEIPLLLNDILYWINHFRHPSVKEDSKELMFKGYVIYIAKAECSLRGNVRELADGEGNWLDYVSMHAICNGSDTLEHVIGRIAIETYQYQKFHSCSSYEHVIDFPCGIYWSQIPEGKDAGKWKLTLTYLHAQGTKKKLEETDAAATETNKAIQDGGVILRKPEQSR